VGAAVFELNLPNFLTVFRILLVPVLVAALLSEGPEGDLLAATVFAVASFTDALDGWIAVDGSPAWVDGIVYVTVAITVLSGADYFFGLRRLLRSGAGVEPVAQRDVAR
jgi:hypothetical protein